MTDLQIDNTKKTWIISSKILILCTQNDLVKKIEKSLINNLQVTQDQILCTDHLQQALTLIKTNHCNFIIIDDFLRDSYQFESYHKLKSLLKEQQIDEDFLLLYLSSSSTPIPYLIDQEIDSFILKPFQENEFIQHVNEMLQKFLHPSTYELLIRNALKDIELKNYEKALRSLELSLSENQKAYQAYYLKGKVFQNLSRTKEQIQNWENALKINQSYYLALKDLANYYLENEESHLKAYDLLLELVKIFPVSQERLIKVIHLAVKFEKFQDIKAYYESYLKMISFINANQATLQAMGAGLYVSGKFHYRQKLFDQGRWHFQEIKNNFNELIDLLKQSFAALMEYQDHLLAEDYISLFQEKMNFNPLFKNIYWESKTQYSIAKQEDPHQLLVHFEKLKQTRELGPNGDELINNLKGYLKEYLQNSGFSSHEINDLLK